MGAGRPAPPPHGRSRTVAPPAEPVVWPEIMTAAETASYLRVSLSQVYDLIKDGEIRAARIGRSWRIQREDLKALFGAAQRTGEIDSDE